MDKQDISQLKGVPETLLIPLYARKLESERPGGLFRDPKAVEIVSKIDYGFERFNGLTAMPSLALRVKAIDGIAKGFLERNSEAVVVQLGAGLDSRFDRLDDGYGGWIDLDLPHIIVLRQQFFDPNPRIQLIAASVLDSSWLDKIPSGPPVIFIAEGLFYYIEEALVRRLLRTLADRFPGAEIVFDTATPLMARLSNRFGAQTRTSAVQTKAESETRQTLWLWGILDGKALEQWDQRLKLVTQEKYLQIYHPDFPAAARVLGKIPGIGNLMSPLIIHLALRD